MKLPLQNDAVGKLVLRLTVGGLILLHGIAKLLHPSALEYVGRQLNAVGLPSVLSYGVLVGEVVAPLLIILGIAARFGGLLVVVNMVFAIWLVHAGELFSMSKNGGWALELQGFYLFCGLAVFFLGSGKLAVRPD
jgi:putative oxidoreductase